MVKRRGKNAITQSKNVTESVVENAITRSENAVGGAVENA